MNHRLDEIPPQVRRLAQLRAAAGIPGTVEISLAVGDPDITIDGLRRYADAGVGRVLVRPWRSRADVVDGLQRFAEQTLHPLQGQ
jgi:hypothetical protein